MEEAKKKKVAVTIQEFIRAILWKLVESRIYKSLNLTDGDIIHIIGKLVSQNENYSQLFKHFRIYFNTQNYPITSKKLSQTLANMTLSYFKIKEVPGGLFTAERILKFDDPLNLQRVINYLQEKELWEIFHMFIIEFKIDVHKKEKREISI